MPVAISFATSELRLAVLLPITGSWPVGAGLIGAVALAVEAVNSDSRILNGRRLSFVWGDDGCDRTTSLAAFSNLLEQHGPIHALIGPGCSRACELTASFCHAKNLPQVSPTCAGPSLSNKKEFPLFIRTTSPYAKWAPAIVSFAQWAGWAILSILSDSAMTESSVALRMRLEAVGMAVGVEVIFDTGRFDEKQQLVSVQKAAVQAVMVFAYASDYLDIALATISQRITHGWGWMGIDMVFGAEQTLEAPDLQLRQASLDGWIYFEPYSIAGKSFFAKVKEASLAYFPELSSKSLIVPPYAANTYDAVLLYAKIAGNYPHDIQNGTKLVAAMRNISFQGTRGAPFRPYLSPRTQHARAHWRTRAHSPTHASEHTLARPHTESLALARHCLQV